MDEQERELVTDEHRALIGVKTKPIEYVISPVDAAYVQEVMEEDDPRYAEGTGITPIYALSILEPQAMNSYREGFMPSILPGAVLTQTEWTEHQPFRPGQTLFTTHEIVDIRERLGGRFGRSVLIISRAEYRDGDGELVAESSHTVTQYDPAGGPREANA